MSGAWFIFWKQLLDEEMISSWEVEQLAQGHVASRGRARIWNQAVSIQSLISYLLFLLSDPE